MVSLMASSSYSFIFIQFRCGIFNFLASSNSDVSCSFICSFLQPQATYKNILSFLHLKKSIIIITQHAVLLVFCIGLFTLFNIYLGMIILTLFVYKINLQHSCCVALHVIWDILTMKICLQICICTCLLFFNCDSASFQIFLY